MTWRTKLFESIRGFIESKDPVTADAKKTHISFGTTVKFEWVWLRKNHAKKRPENSIRFTFNAGQHIVHDWIAEAVESRPGRWTLQVITKKSPTWIQMFRNGSWKHMCLAQKEQG